ncbi:type II toxin-antitoxin system PemK/MazF family toxin [Lactococcus ileimucosae]|uniref:type II toxin-antitoxin system PemK/MazF family toxin n=1 Tax=Lactococcus ileimucosae TaxID=2941329 RepID=UPI002043309A|nr:type II toxin-antitoxin system PemK/MazF family toxin [Lactococcus ileimucosae]
MTEYIKDFDSWNEIQKNLNSSSKPKFFKKREIWWAAVGVNVGNEVDGKNEVFERPVLVIKKINATSAFVIPLTSTIRENDDRYVTYTIKGKKRSAMISQARMMDTRRFRRRMRSKMSNKDFRNILNCFKKQFSE